MAPICSKGVVTFASRPRKSYRYELTLNEDFVTMWLEDRTSREQWESDKLTMPDIVSSKDAIPYASFAEYIALFRDSLETKTMGGTAECHVNLAMTYDSGVETLRLKFHVVLKAASATWTPTYCMYLKRVALERCDILEARIRDLEDKLNAQEQQMQIEATEAKPRTAGPVCLRVSTTTAATHNSLLAWVHCDHSNGNVNFTVEPSGKIRFLLPGLYQFNLIINHRNTNTVFGAYKLCKNDIVMQTGRGLSASCSVTVSTCQSLILKVDKGDEISVEYIGTQTAVAGSTMSAVLLK